MIRLPPRSTRTDTLFPYTTLFRSEWTGNVGFDYSVPTRLFGNNGTLSFLPRASYRSKTNQFETDSFLLDQGGYTLFDASIVWNSDDGRWTVGLHGRNPIGRASWRTRV